MSQGNEVLVREAYEAYGRGDVDRMLTFVDPDLEWTFLNPSEPDPPPRTCHGRDQLAWALRRQARQGLTSQIEEITARGEQVLVVIHTPGVDQTRARPSRGPQLPGADAPRRPDHRHAPCRTIARRARSPA